MVDLSDLQDSWESAEIPTGGGSGEGKFVSTIVEGAVKENERGKYIEWAFTKPGLEFPLRKFIPIKKETEGLIKKELDTLKIPIPKDINELPKAVAEAIGLQVEINAVKNKAGRKNKKGYVILNYYFNKLMGRDRVMTEAAELLAMDDADDLLS